MQTIQVGTVAHNTEHDRNSESPDKVATWSVFCSADMGGTGADFFAVPGLPPRNMTWFKQGKRVHWSEMAFDKFSIRNMEKGVTETAY